MDKQLLKYLAIGAMSVAGINGYGDLFSDSVIGPESRVDWVLTGVEGNIPAAPETVINVMEYGGFDNTGAVDNSAALQALLNGLENDAVIYFPAGEYLMNGGVVFEIGKVPGVIIRGAGAELTEFVFTDYPSGQGTMFAIRGQVSTMASNFLIKPPGKGSQVLYPNRPEKFEVGDYVHLVQENKLTGFNSMEPGYVNEEYLKQYANGYGIQATGQIFKVVAIDDGKLIVDDETSMDFDWGGAFVTEAYMIKNIGFENFKVTNLQPKVVGFFNFNYAANCWITGVHCEKTTTSHVAINRSRNISIYGCYFDDSYDHGGGGRGYGVAIGKHSSNIRVENNIFQHMRHSMIMAHGPNGNVFAYNYSLNGIQDGASVAVDLSGHGFFPNTTLYEGNIVQRVGNSDYWGPDGNFMTYFRNLVYLADIAMNDNTNYTNCVGNILSNGSITNSNGASFTFEHGNISRGVLTWAEGYPETVVDSLCYLSKPGWWNIEDPWPSIGPEYPDGPYTIPAKKRFEDGHLTLDNRDGFSPWPSGKYIRNNYITVAHQGLDYLNALVLVNAEGVTSWTETSDVLSSIGLELRESGLIVGVPAAAGTYQVDVEATDESGNPVSGSIEVVIEEPSVIVLEEATTPWGAVNIPYSFQIVALNLHGSAVFSLLSGTLPAGLELQDDGDIEGTPLEAGTFPITMTIRDTEVAGSDVQIPIEVRIQPYTVSENLIQNGEFDMGENGLEFWDTAMYDGAVMEMSITDDANQSFQGLIPTPASRDWLLQLMNYFPTQRENLYALYLTADCAVPQGRIRWALQEVGGDFRVRTSGSINGWGNGPVHVGPIYYKATATDDDLRLTLSLGEMPTNRPFTIDNVLVRRIVDNGVASRGPFFNDTHAGYGYFYSDWLGYYYSQLPYLWHPQPGWLYMYPGSNVNKVYFYSFDTGDLIYTKKSYAPWYWDYASSQWLSFEP